MVVDIPRRILTIKLADLGDVLLCEPAFASLRRSFPSAQIDVLTLPSSAGLVALMSHDLRPRTFPKHIFDQPAAALRPRALATAMRLAAQLRLARYELVVILHHLTTPFGALKFRLLAAATGAKSIAGLDNGRGGFLSQRVTDFGFGERHEAEYMLDVAQAAGGALVHPVPRIVPPEQHGDVPDLPEDFAAIFPATGSFSRAREWPAARYGDLATRLRLNGLQSVIVGGADACDAALTILAAEGSALDLTGRTSLRTLIHVLQRARVVIGGDSFIGHLAGALGQPVVSIFGPTNASAWRPLCGQSASGSRSPAIVVRHDLPCEPCMYTGYRLGRTSGCRHRTCLQLVTVADVERAIVRAMEAA
jgi:heptosyltransferase-2